MSFRSGKRKKKKQVLDPLGYLLLGLGLITCFMLITHYDVTQDDAYINYRYAINYLEGHGLVYNIGERVEGYTNFLWTLWIVLAGLAGCDLILTGRILGISFGLANILLIFFASREWLQAKSKNDAVFISGLCTFLLGAFYSYAYWAGAGLETAAFTLALTLFVLAYSKGSSLAVPTAVISVLLRPEGMLLIAFLVIGELLWYRRLHLGIISIIFIIAIFLVPYAIFKINYYGSLLPNTFYAKTTFSLDQVKYGLIYAGRFFYHYTAFGLFLIPAIIAAIKFKGQIRIIAIVLAVFTGYIIVIGGDVLKVHRFFVPIVGLIIVFTVHGIFQFLRKRIFVFLFCLAVLAWQLLVPRGYVNTYHFQEKGLADKVDKLMTELLKADNGNFTLAVSTIGLVGYRLMGHAVIDLLGLTDIAIARHPEPPVAGLETTWRESKFNSQYILSRQPDYILFSTGYKPSAPAERALFMYSAFLENYRIINFTFYYGGDLHSVYKRYYPITGEISRDIDVRFVQSYNRAINLSARGQWEEALKVLDTTVLYNPDPPYPYIHYFMAEAHRRLTNYDASYGILRELIRRDTLVYDAYEDLYIFEKIMKNDSAAAYYRRKMANLVPWRVREVDYLLSRAKELQNQL